MRFSERGDLRRGGQPHLVSPGQGRLHDVLHVRGRAQAPYALPGQSRLQSERERLRLARERRGLPSSHAGATRLIAPIITTTHKYTEIARREDPRMDLTERGRRCRRERLADRTGLYYRILYNPVDPDRRLF